MPGADLVTSADRWLLEAVTDLRASPVTTLVILLSAWWMKSLVIAAVGAAADLRRRPRALPLTPLLAALAFWAASLATSALKDVVGRARPTLAEPGLHALIAVPGDASFPSGHASTAFAAAGVVAALHPGLRAGVLSLAALIALSRVYLGVHYPLDVLAGAALGIAIAAVVIGLARRLGLTPRRPEPFTRARSAARIRPWWRSTPST